MRHRIIIILEHTTDPEYVGDPVAHHEIAIAGLPHHSAAQLTDLLHDHALRLTDLLAGATPALPPTGGSVHPFPGREGAGG